MTNIDYDDGNHGIFAQINELAKDYPGLTKFKNMDLSPYSWMAVAWYVQFIIPSTFLFLPKYFVGP